MKISNTIQHYKKRVRRKFWPSKCLKSGHNLLFLLYSNVSKCPLHLLIILPSSKFVSADCLFSRACSFSYFTFWGMLTCERHTCEKRRIGKQREALEDHTQPITIQSHWGRATWEVTKTKTRFEKQILLYIAKIRAISYWLWKTICFWPRQMYDVCRHLNVTYKAFLLAGLKVKTSLN